MSYFAETPFKAGPTALLFNLWQAAQLAGLHEVPTVIIEADNLKSLEFAGTALNYDGRTQLQKDLILSALILHLKTEENIEKCFLDLPLWQRLSVG